MALTNSQPNNINVPSGNGLVVYIDGENNQVYVRDVRGATEELNVLTGSITQIIAEGGLTALQVGNVVTLGTDSSIIQLKAEKGQPNGYASLDASGKLPVSELPVSVLTYEGMWNAATNTPFLEDGVGNAGDFYIVNVAGTQDLGSGPISFEVGDWVIYNGAEWQRNSSNLPDLQEVTDVGATTTNAITTGGITTPYVQLDTTATPTMDVGMARWNDQDGTWEIGMKRGNATLQVGMETYYPPVVNKSGGTLTDGILVMVDPTDVAQGNRLRIVKAVTDGTYPTELLLGILTEPINNNQEGYATWFGYVRNLSLSTLKPAGETWVEGDILYGNPTIPGGLTKVAPVAPALKAPIAAITRINGNNLTLLVRPTFKPNLGQNNDVQLTSPIDNSILQYNSTTKVWENVAGTTTNIAEGTNLYFTTARARESVSAGTGISYDSGTGVITNSDRGSSQNIFKNVAVATQNTIVADSNDDTLTFAAGTNISLTTNAETDTLTINTTGVPTGSGVANYVALWSSASNLTTSQIYDNGTAVGIATATPSSLLQIGNTTDQKLNFDFATANEVKMIAQGYVFTIANTPSNPAFPSALLLQATSNSGVIQLMAASNTITYNSTGLFAINATGGDSTKKLYVNGNAIVGNTSGTTPANFEVSDYVAGVSETIGLRNRADNATGRGTKISFKTGGSPFAEKGSISVTAIDGNRDGYNMAFGTTATGGTISPKLTLFGSGAAQLNLYGSGTYTGTAAYNLAVDASGNIIETAGSVIDGSGTTNYLSKFTDSNTIGDSQVFDNGTNVGIGTTSPSQLLHVNGAVRITGSLYDSTNDPGAVTEFLSSTGSGTSWATAVTSVGLSVPTGFAIANSPVTTSGTIALSFATGYSLPTDARQTEWDNAYNDSITAFAYNTGNGVLTLTQRDLGTLTATVTLQPFSTTNLAEGTNLYYTDARARAALSAGTGITYDSGTGVITNSDRGSSQFIFKNVAVTGSNLIVADSNDDTITFTAGSGVTLSSDATTDTITISATGLGGTVTSVSLSAPTGFTVSGSPVTTSGTLSLGFDTGYSLPTNASQANWTDAYDNKITAVSFNSGTLTLTQQDTGTLTTSLDGRYILLTEKGANNGVATLDAGGKIPASQLPSSVFEYKGTWNAATNTPTLVDGVGDPGDVYLVSTAGTHDFGDGPISFAVGDLVLYDGAEWQKSASTNDVLSVNGQTGVVVLTTTNIGEGTNLYFTDARARAAISGGTGINYNSTTGTITNSDLGSSQNIFKNIEVAGQSTVTAEINNDTLTLVAGTNISITTNATTDTITINSTDQFVGTVTSVAMSVPTGFTISGTPITTSGTLGLAFATGYSLPTDASQSNWNTAYDNSITNFGYNTSNGVLTLTQQDAGTLTATITLQPFSTTNLAEGTNLYFTDARARGAISLTTSGTSGAATYNSTTGVINVPQYQSALTNPVTGTGTTNYVTKWASSSSVTDSQIFDNGTNVGISNATPGEKLDITGNARVSSYYLFNGNPGNPGGSTASIYDQAGVGPTISGLNVAFRAGSTPAEIMRVSSTGVLIGTTTSSDEALTVYGASEAAVVFQNSTSGTGSGNGLYLGVLNSENYLWTYEAQPLIFGTNNAEQVRITSAGNVGIATTSPQSKLDIVKQGNASGGTMMLSGSKTNNAVKYGVITTAQYASDTETEGVGLIGGTNTSTENIVNIGGGVDELNTATSIRFFAAANTTTRGSANERMRVNAANDAGNLYIGTTSTNDYGRLIVNGFSGAWLPYIAGTSLSYNQFGIVVGSANTGNTNIGGGLTLVNNNASVGAYGPVVSWSSMTAGGAYNSTYAFITGVYGGQGGDTNWAIGDILFGTAATYGAEERMRIRYNGNVLIGTTTDAGYKLYVNGTGTSTNLAVVGNIKAGGTGTAGGEIIASGALGNGNFVSLRHDDTNAYITVTRTVYDGHLILQPYGNVGIGTTAPGAKLDIVSTGAGSEGLRVDGAGGGFAFVVKAGSDYTSHIRAGATIGVNYFTTPPSNGLIVEGNVGIGTTSPVNCALAINQDWVSGSATVKAYPKTTMASGGLAGFGIFDSNGTTRVAYMAGTSSNMELWAQSNIPMNFGTNDTQRMRITAGGNLLIGTTTDAGYKLRVNGTGRYDGNVQLWADVAGASPRLIFGGETSSTDKSIFLESFYMVFQGHDNEGFKFQTTSSLGVVTNRMSILGTGTIQFSNYGSGAKTGTPAYNLGVDASGNVIELPGGVVDGSGTANYVTKWQDANTVTNSIIRDDGTTVGIGQAPAAAKLSVETITTAGETSYGKSYGSLDTTGVAVAGLSASTNGQSAMFTFTCYGGESGYQRIVYSCYNGGGNWYTSKVIDEGTNTFDVTASANGSTITFTYKARTASQAYSPRILIQHLGTAIDTSYL